MSENKLKIERKTVVRLLVMALVLAVLTGGIYLIFRAMGWTQIDRETLQEYLAGKGALAPVIFIALSFLQVTFIPIPSAVTIVAGSYLFGAWRSFLYSYIGIVGGSLFAFWLGGRLGRPFVDWAFGGKTEAERYISRMQGKETVVLFFMFLLPMFPDDALCAVAGVLGVKAPAFLFMQLTTRVTSILGTLFFLSGEFIPYNTWWGILIIVTVAVAALVAFYLAFRNSDKINAAFDRVMDKMVERFKKK